MARFRLVANQRRKRDEDGARKWQNSSTTPKAVRTTTGRTTQTKRGTRLSPQLKPAQLEEVVIGGIENGKVKPTHTNQAELFDAVRAALDPLWKPDADVAETLQDVCSAIQPQLEK